MTFGELLTEVYANGFDYLDDGGAGETRVKRWVNQSYQELCAANDWPFLEATATGAAPLTISDLGKVLYVVNTDTYQTLIESDAKSISTIGYPSGGGSSAMYYYITGGDTVATYPAAGNALSVRYIKTPTDLSASSDTPLVPTPWQDIIVLGAVRRALLDDTDSGSLGVVRQEWSDRVQMMQSALMNPISGQHLSGASGDW